MLIYFGKGMQFGLSAMYGDGNTEEFMLSLGVVGSMIEPLKEKFRAYSQAKITLDSVEKDFVNAVVGKNVR